MINIYKICPICGENLSVVVSDEQGFEYLYTDKLVQEIFPDESATFREILISGICPKCQKEIFGEQ